MDGQPALSRDVLIVEDDLLIALDLEATVISLGAASVRTAQTVAQALRMIDERMPDFAFLNIDLGPEQSFAVAERLLALAVGFVFVSGYGHDARMPVHLIGIPRLEKPYSIEMIAQALRPLKEPPA
jgi:two-component SAPR family response regulator